MMNTLIEIARQVRVDILKMFYQSQTGHLAPALSCVDILVFLYYGGFINRDNLFNEWRDRVILSKGHACAALYAILARVGYFPRKELLTFYKKESRLGGHPDIQLPGIETPTGSLGHGICFATGVAKAAKLDGEDYRTYVVVGDGELQEGSVWEAASFAVNHKLDNITVIVDRNDLQASTFIKEIVPFENIREKWEAFGWNTIEVDGHDFTHLKKAFSQINQISGKPSVIIAHTVKGKGIQIAERNPNWHSRVPKRQEWEVICQELGIDIKELSHL